MLLFLIVAALANTPPSAPVILEPAIELQALNGADVHMVTSQFVDADGDAHFCTDWEIREEQQVVWSAPCVEGPLKVHIHLGDGVFSGLTTAHKCCAPIHNSSCACVSAMRPAPAIGPRANSRPSSQRRSRRCASTKCVKCNG